MAYKILVVEDEEIIRFGLQENLEMEGYEVDVAEDGEQAVQKADSFRPDLVLLDLMLPKKSGIEVCRVIRKKHPRTYIIMLTAKTDEMSKVAGLEMGADDYVTKPFSVTELLARIKAFLRRAAQLVEEVKDKSEDVIEFAGIRLDFKKYEGTKNGVPVDLSAREFQVLRYFWKRRGEVVKREELLQDIWGYTTETMPSTRTIDNHIVSLRKKLEDDPANPRMILSVRSAGYKFDV